MPNFNFYINDEERAELISYILSKRTKIVPDELYPSETFKVLKTIEDYYAYMEKGECKFFLLNDIYTTEPILNIKNRFIEKPSYSISQRKGGPYIDLFFYLGFSDDATIQYKRSVIDFYSQFIHYDNCEEFYAPEELKNFYNDLVKFIKSKCSLIKKNNKNYWISKVVLNDIVI